MGYSIIVIFVPIVAVYDGHTDEGVQKWGPWCGRRPRFTLYGTNASMMIHAVTDNYVGKYGFRAVYQVCIRVAFRVKSHVIFLNTFISLYMIPLPHTPYYIKYLRFVRGRLKSSHVFSKLN